MSVDLRRLEEALDGGEPYLLPADDVRALVRVVRAALGVCGEFGECLVCAEYASSDALDDALALFRERAA